VNRTRWLPPRRSARSHEGGGAALASTASSNPASDFFSDVAKHLGISQEELVDAIKDATIASIDAAVAADAITKEKGDALRERVRSGDLPPSCRASAARTSGCSIPMVRSPAASPVRTCSRRPPATSA
jgi:hypothetical protein